MNLIIDTCVLCAAGEPKSRDTCSQRSRRILEAILENKGHSLVISREICDEYRRCNNRFSKTWLYTMKMEHRWVPLKNTKDMELRNEIKSGVETIHHNSKVDDVCRVIKKDLHLVEAAIRTDKLILSEEKKFRDHIRRIASNPCCLTNSRECLGCVIWLRPSDCSEQGIDLPVLINNETNLSQYPFIGHLLIPSVN